MSVQHCCGRYFLNNFRDGHKQDALDLVTGAFEMVPGKPATFPLQPSPALPLLAALAALFFAFSNFRALLQVGAGRMCLGPVSALWAGLVFYMLTLGLVPGWLGNLVLLLLYCLVSHGLLCAQASRC
jgi:hypothetical protein